MSAAVRVNLDSSKFSSGQFGANLGYSETSHGHHNIVSVNAHGATVGDKESNMADLAMSKEHAIKIVTDSNVESTPLDVLEDEETGIAAHMEQILRLRLKLRPSESLPAGMQDTPLRFAKAFVEQTKGLDLQLAHIEENIMTVFVESSRVSPEPVAMHRIPFHSMCEHHLLPFTGAVSIEYVPGTTPGASPGSSSTKRILGLSKLARIVDLLARQFQVQERLTEQIAEALFDSKKLSPAGVAVQVRATHGCMQCRGVCVPQGSCVTVTKAFCGASYMCDEAAGLRRREQFERGCDSNASM